MPLKIDEGRWFSTTAFPHLFLSINYAQEKDHAFLYEMILAFNISLFQTIAFLFILSFQHQRNNQS